MRLSVLTLDDGTFELSLDLLSEADDESRRRAVARDVVKDAITHAIASNPSAQWPPKPPASPRSGGASRGISGGLSRGLSREGLSSRAALSSRGLSSRLSSAPPSRRARRDVLSAASQAFEEAPPTLPEPPPSGARVQALGEQLAARLAEPSAEAHAQAVFAAWSAIDHPERPAGYQAGLQAFYHSLLAVGVVCTCTEAATLFSRLNGAHRRMGSSMSTSKRRAPTMAPTDIVSISMGGASSSSNWPLNHGELSEVLLEMKLVAAGKTSPVARQRARKDLKWHHFEQILLPKANKPSHVLPPLERDRGTVPHDEPVDPVHITTGLIPRASSRFPQLVRQQPRQMKITTATTTTATTTIGKSKSARGERRGRGHQGAPTRGYHSARPHKPRPRTPPTPEGSEAAKQTAEQMRLLMTILESKDAMSELLGLSVNDAMTGRGSRLSHPGYPFAGKSKEHKARAAEERRMMRAAVERRRRTMAQSQQPSRRRRDIEGPDAAAAQELTALETTMVHQATERAQEARRERDWDRVHGKAFRDILTDADGDSDGGEDCVYDSAGLVLVASRLTLPSI